MSERKEPKDDRPPVIVQIPFHGFYESIHGADIDRAYQYIISDNNGEPYEELQEELYSLMSTTPEHPYAKAYVEAFNGYLKYETGHDLGLVIESMASPREYNFTTDRIFCSISAKEAVFLKKDTPEVVFADVAKDMFTSRDGFMSYYEPDIDAWPESVLDYDHNEMYALLVAWLKHSGITDVSDIDYVVFDYGDMGEVAYIAVNDTMSPELEKLADRAIELREKEVLKEEHKANQLQLI